MCVLYIYNGLQVNATSRGQPHVFVFKIFVPFQHLYSGLRNVFNKPV